MRLMKLAVVAAAVSVSWAVQAQSEIYYCVYKITSSGTEYANVGGEGSSSKGSKTKEVGWILFPTYVDSTGNLAAVAATDFISVTEKTTKTGFGGSTKTYTASPNLGMYAFFSPASGNKVFTNISRYCNYLEGIDCLWSGPEGKSFNAAGYGSVVKGMRNKKDNKAFPVCTKLKGATSYNLWQAESVYTTGSSTLTLSFDNKAAKKINEEGPFEESFQVLQTALATLGTLYKCTIKYDDDLRLYGTYRVASAWHTNTGIPFYCKTDGAYDGEGGGSSSSTTSLGDSSQNVSLYTAAEDGSLNIITKTITGEEVNVSTGMVSPDGLVMASIDTGAALDSLFGMATGVKKSFGMTKASLKGTYNSAIFALSKTRGAQMTKKAVWTFNGDNTGYRILIRSDGTRTEDAFTYSINSNGTFTISIKGETLSYAVSPDLGTIVGNDDFGDKSGSSGHLDVGVKASTADNPKTAADLNGSYGLMMMTLDSTTNNVVYSSGTIRFDGISAAVVTLGSATTAYTYAMNIDGTFDIKAKDTLVYNGAVNPDDNVINLVDFDATDNSLSTGVGVKKSE